MRVTPQVSRAFHPPKLLSIGNVNSDSSNTFFPFQSCGSKCCDGTSETIALGCSLHYSFPSSCTSYVLVQCNLFCHYGDILFNGYCPTCRSEGLSLQLVGDCLHLLHWDVLINCLQEVIVADRLLPKLFRSFARLGLLFYLFIGHLFKHGIQIC